MIPDKTTRIKTSDILVRPEAEYRIGDKASLIGWLRELFLYGSPEIEYRQTTNTDRKDYNEAVKSLRKHANLTKYSDLHQFEEKVTAKKAVLLLNKIIKDMTK